jgi:SAM-dependent methyltransferase
MADNNTDVEQIACNLCGADHFDVYLEQDDRRYSNTPRGKFRLVKCRHCGLIYLNPRPTAAAISAFYPDSFYADRPATNGNNRDGLERLTVGLDPTKRRARAALLEKQLVVSRAFAGPGRLLDVGCAAGEFLVRMRSLGWSVEGADISPYMCEYVRGKFGITCHNKSINSLELRSGSFDVITFWASMEHLFDPKSALQACHRALDDSGIVVILVPNADSLEEKWLRDVDPNPVDIPRHLYHFSSTSLERMLKCAGFEPLFVSHYTRNAADRFAVVMTDFIETYFKSGSALGRMLRLVTKNFAMLTGDLISRLLALSGRSHSFIIAARRV